MTKSFYVFYENQSSPYMKIITDKAVMIKMNENIFDIPNQIVEQQIEFIKGYFSDKKINITFESPVNNASLKRKYNKEKIKWVLELVS